MQFIKIN